MVPPCPKKQPWIRGGTIAIEEGFVSSSFLLD
jgi:hypothetical protein